MGRDPTTGLLADDSDLQRDVAIFLQAQFEDNLGAQIDVKVQPFDRRLELESAGDYQMVITAWIGDYNDPMTFQDLFTSESPFNSVLSPTRTTPGW